MTPINQKDQIDTNPISKKIVILYINSDLIPLLWRTRFTDFINSGFDRGHLVPSADFYNQDDMNDSFYLSNVSPQVGVGFNRGYWSRLEFFIRRRITPLFDQVIVYTGPMYLPKQDSESTATLTIKLIGNPPSIFIPTHFFKVILAKRDSEYYHAAFILPNEPIDHEKPLMDFLTPIDVISRSSGFKFFDELKTKPLCQSMECAFTKLLKRKNNDELSTESNHPMTNEP
jgi:endonuclease G, mitochondrial